MPGMPSVPRYTGSGASLGSTLVTPLSVDDGVFLHAQPSVDVLADGKSWVLRRNDPAERQRAHDFADPDRRNVGAAFVHPAAHGRIERDIKDLDQNLAVGGFGTGSSR